MNDSGKCEEGGNYRRDTMRSLAGRRRVLLMDGY